ncbi:two-component sensor histidine kinase [Skermania sp. ID1734]|nr:two-component sensor histidine kinase [Skermania sp. ID1734]
MSNLPHNYPPIIPLVSDISLLTVTVVALVQRDAFIPPRWPLLAGFIAIAPILWVFAFDYKPSERTAPLVLAAGAIVSTGLLLLEPRPADAAPFIMMIVVGEVAATATLRIGICVAAATAVVLAVPTAMGRLDNAPVYLMLIPLGWCVGFMLQTQMRLLERERESQQQRAEQAASDERRRIAREVHDVVAHSLSVTLLHLTGARRALQEDNDVNEAVEALIDAERLGRQAMSDIRRTVGLLDDSRGKTTPEPGLGDLDDLVAGFIRAGLRLDFTMHGDADRVSASIGLALYRIAQESLANIAKHAPGAKAELEVTVRDTKVTVTATNTTAKDQLVGQGGSGLIGMRQRAELLGGNFSAGPSPEGWSVRAEIPLAAQADSAGCWFQI